MAKSIMFQGTGSDVGKSLVVAGVCRALKKRGLKPSPFKPQNMSNNAGVTVDGGEIGRAQMLQAQACGLKAVVHMNPVLLKPQSNMGSQVIVQGKVLENADSSYFRVLKPKLMKAVLESFNRLKSQSDIVVIEGAGSPAEINLREGDIANMGFAEQADVPVVLVVDVDRGGSIASVVGTMAILPDSEKARIKGYIINKFRGDVKLFQGALDEIEKHCSLKCLGVLPWFEGAKILPAEDAVALDKVDSFKKKKGRIKICVPRLPRIANFDDLDPLRQEPDVDVHIISTGEVIPTDADVVLLVGSKSTLGDLTDLKANGWDIDIIAHNRRGGIVMGICAGYQMLGKALHDPNNIESAIDTMTGLSLLDTETTMVGDKKLVQVSGTASGINASFTGYEMHMGKTTGRDTSRPFAILSNGSTDGAISIDGTVMGTYVHGIFSDDTFRNAFLNTLRSDSIATVKYNQAVEQTLDDLACHMEQHLDIDGVLNIAQ